MARTVIGSFFRNGGLLRKLRRMRKIYESMKQQCRIQIDKLLWRVVSEGAPRFDQEFDLAVAWLEGASAYYTADHVNAEAKAAVVHINLERAGYTPEMNLDCFDAFDRIFAVSEETRKSLIHAYPEHDEKIKVLHNLIDAEGIRLKAQSDDGFTDNYDGIRLLTVGRLEYQKAYDVAIEAMKILKDSGEHVRWYVLGEGSERRALEKKIRALNLEDDFVLLGATDNPYPYYAQADIYVHATRVEGMSIAIQEAQILGRPVIATDCDGNREPVENGRDGVLCRLEPASIAASVTDLVHNEEKRRTMGDRAAAKDQHQHEHELQNLFQLAGPV